MSVKLFELVHKEIGMDSLRSVNNTAEILGVSPYTIRAWIRRGLLASVKLGTRRLVTESEIQRGMENGLDTLQKSNDWLPSQCKESSTTLS